MAGTAKRWVTRAARTCGITCACTSTTRAWWTDELVDYIHRAHTWSQEFIDARRQSVSLPHDYTQDLAQIQAPVLLIHGRYDRMVPFEVGIAILNHIADSRLVLLNNCGHWPPFEKPAEWTAQFLALLKGYREGRVGSRLCQSARRILRGGWRAEPPEIDIATSPAERSS